MPVSIVTSQQEGAAFESMASWGCSVWRLHVLSMPVWALSGLSGSLPQSMHELTGNSKLAVGVNDCLSLSVSPATGCSVPCLSSYDSWDSLQPPSQA